MAIPRRVRLIPPYLMEVFVRSKLALSGGVAIIAVLIVEWVSGQSLQKGWHIAAVVVAVIGAQFWHGLVQFGQTHPPLRIVYPKQQFWNEGERRGSTGMGYYFEVLNPSETESLEVTVQTAMVVDFAEGGGWALAGAGDGSEPQSVNS
jgi:hypothetical protein